MIIFSKYILKEIIIKKSHNPNKKYDAIIDNRTISFDASGYPDFTTTQDIKKKENYIKRHGKEDWSRNNLESAAFMSRWILWNKPSIQESITYLNKLYKDVKFKYN